MSEERLQEIKDSVSFQKEILLAHNMDTLCVDEEEELIEEIERLTKVEKEHQRINGELREENDIAQEKVKSAIKEIERLNNIIKRLEEDLREMYLTFGEFSEEYTENRIKELKGENSEFR